MILCELNLWHRLEYLLDVCLHELHHQEYVSNICEITRRYYIKNLCRKVVLGHLCELSQNLHFPDDLLAVIFVLEDVIDQFDCDNPTSLPVFCLDNFSIASYANQLDEVIIFIRVLPYVRKTD